MATAPPPCGACRFLRRKCRMDCIFAPYFCSEQGPESFAAIHKVFGASNVSKLLSHVPVAARRDSIITIAFEAQSRIKDPIYGCVSHVIALQQQVEYLQDQVMQMKAQIDNQSSRIAENQWPRCINMDAGIGSSPTLPDYINYSNSPQGLSDSINGIIGRQLGTDQSCSRDEDFSFQSYSKIPSQTELSELQELALRMMKNEN